MTAWTCRSTRSRSWNWPAHRHLRRRHHHRRPATTTSAATTATASSATAASATTSASASSASGPLPCPESPRAATRRREAQDPGGALLGRQGATRSLAPLTARPCGQPVTAARHDQAPELPGQAGGRSGLDKPTPTPRGPPSGRPSFLADVRFGRYVRARKIPCPQRVLRAKGSNNQRRVMKGIIRRLRPSPAMVVACIALVFAMTGAGYAAGMLGPEHGRHQAAQEERCHLIQGQEPLASGRRLQGRTAPAAKGAQGDSGAPGRARPSGPSGPARPIRTGARCGRAVRPGSDSIASSESSVGQVIDLGTRSGSVVSTARELRRERWCSVGRSRSPVPATVNDCVRSRGTAVASSCAPPASSSSLIDCPVDECQHEFTCSSGELNHRGDTAALGGVTRFYVAAVGPDAPATGSPAKPAARRRSAWTFSAK